MPSRTRTVGDGVLVGCSICGCAFDYPKEIRRCPDGLWRCLQWCMEESAMEEAKRVAAFRAGHRDRINGPPGSIPPGNGRT